MADPLMPLDLPRLRREWLSAEPFPHIKIEPFLQPDLAKAIAASYPSFEQARTLGQEFRAVNETGKIQITDTARFPEPIKELAVLLASPSFLAQLAQITGIEDLLADPALSGGGMHMTGPEGRLDVHVDFNVETKTRWHRRLNLLLYFNADWRPEWRGAVELWDRDVKKRHHAYAPLLNRCVIFETSQISYHGVEQVDCPPGVARKSFAAYYYTEQPPEHWNGVTHNTIFRARPDEKLKGYVLMPSERVARTLGQGVRRAFGFAERRLRGVQRDEDEKS